VVGQTLTVNGVPLTIVGVAPRGFHGTTVGARASIFVPISFRAGGTPGSGSIPNHDDRNTYWVHLFARLGAGVSREEAEAAINPLYRAILNKIEAPLASGADEPTLEQFRTKSSCSSQVRVDKARCSLARQRVAQRVPLADQARLVEVVETEIMSLHEGNIARYRLRPAEYQAWRQGWR
jgi:hypothetical protein